MKEELFRFTLIFAIQTGVATYVYRKMVDLIEYLLQITIKLASD